MARGTIEYPVGTERIPLPSGIPIPKKELGLPTTSLVGKRIHVVDALRGFALFGIAGLHCIEHFDIADTGNAIQAVPALDNLVARSMFMLFEGKAYSIFSILFGLSFFIQLESGSRRGVDFRGRFIWRMAILGAFGYIHTLFYAGDVLTLFALFGVPLVLLHRARSKVLLVLATTALLQPPALIALIRAFASPGPSPVPDWGPWETGMNVWAHGTFGEVLGFNSLDGHAAKWAFMVNSGRYLQMAGLILVGLLIGRSGVFRNIKRHARTLRAAMLVGLAGWVVLHVMHKLVPSAPLAGNEEALLSFLTKSWSDLCASTFLISAFMVIYTRFFNKSENTWLSTYGRMSLTNYVTQGIVGSIVFYGYGLAMYQQWGATLSLCFGVFLFALQVVVSWQCSKKHRQGPLERLWRTLTMMHIDPVRGSKGMISRLRPA